MAARRIGYQIMFPQTRKENDMIIRILGEGRFDVPGRAVPGVARLYDRVQDAARSGNEEAFARILPNLLDEVRTQGEYLGTEQLDDADALFPPADATIQDARFVGEVGAMRHAGVIAG
jgi:hypothetical protein